MLALYSPRPMTVTDGPPTVYDYLAWYLVEIYRLMSGTIFVFERDNWPLLRAG